MEMEKLKLIVGASLSAVLVIAGIVGIYFKVPDAGWAVGVGLLLALSQLD
jgi:hypothetical protein